MYAPVMNTIAPTNSSAMVPANPDPKKALAKQGDHHERNQYRRAAAHRDCGVDVSRSSHEDAQIVVYLTGIGGMARQ